MQRYSAFVFVYLLALAVATTDMREYLDYLGRVSEASQSHFQRFF